MCAALMNYSRPNVHVDSAILLVEALWCMVLWRQSYLIRDRALEDTTLCHGWLITIEHMKRSVIMVNVSMISCWVYILLCITVFWIIDIVTRIATRLRRFACDNPLYKKRTLDRACTNFAILSWRKQLEPPRTPPVLMTLWHTIYSFLLLIVCENVLKWSDRTDLARCAGR